MNKYDCTIMNYLHDEAVNAPGNEMALGTLERDIDNKNELTFEELSALCSGISKRCEKQERFEEADLFNQLAKYYHSKMNQKAVFFTELAEHFRMVSAIEEAHKESFRQLFKNSEVRKGKRIMWECRICGHVAIGNKVQEVCPECHYRHSHFMVTSKWRRDELKKKILEKRNKIS